MNRDSASECLISGLDKNFLFCPNSLEFYPKTMITVKCSLIALFISEIQISTFLDGIIITLLFELL